MANYRVSTNTHNSNKTTQGKTNKKQTKMDQISLFKLIHDLLKISVDLRTVFAADTHLAEGQWLKVQLNSRMFRVGTRIPTVSRAEGQCLVPLKAFIKNNASK
jgi:hypothetical protein